MTAQRAHGIFSVELQTPTPVTIEKLTLTYSDLKKIVTDISNTLLRLMILDVKSNEFKLLKKIKEIIILLIIISKEVDALEKEHFSIKPDEYNKDLNNLQTRICEIYATTSELNITDSKLRMT